MLVLVLVSVLAICQSFYVTGFYVMGKALSGELSFPCDTSCLDNYDGFYNCPIFWSFFTVLKTYMGIPFTVCLELPLSYGKKGSISMGPAHEM